VLSAPSDLARSVLDAAPDAIVIISAGGHIRYVNQQALALFGYAREALIGQPIELLVPARFRARHVEHRQGYMDARRVRPMGAGLTLWARHQDGSEIPVEISLSPIPHETEVLVAAAIREVADRRRVEAELIQARETAEQAREAADVERAIADAARASAHRADQNKSRFLASASHDLRQPLQTLALLNGTLRRMVHDPDVATAVAQQELAIGAMSRLVNALLDISKLESGAIKPELTDFTVASLFDELQRDFANLATTKGLALQVEPCVESVHSDPSLVEQILRNLVSNAIKYTREGWVRLRCLHHRSLVRIEVLDTGIGIPTEQLPHIYEEFYQVDPGAESARGGYGLGLSIVQRIVKLLQLELVVRSEVGKGSLFALLLPASAGRTAIAPPEAKDEVPREPQAPRRRVLLVEDDASVRDATRLLLRVEGYQVTAVASLSEALEQLSREKGVDLIVTDYHLRDETGLQVIAAIREAAGQPLKAVLITGDTSSAIKGLSGDPGLRVTSKPVKADELLSLLQELLA
jgi:PAS domain S-box-containing protein